MDKHFLQLQAYQTKNKANKEIQDYARQWDNALVDDEHLEKLEAEMRAEIDRINVANPRCKDINLCKNSYTSNSMQLSVWENFYLVAHKVNREELNHA